MRRRAHLSEARGSPAYRRAPKLITRESDSVGATMQKRRIHRETGAGQHGVATATVCRAVRFAVRRLHGSRRHAAPGPECLSHAVAGRRSGAKLIPDRKTLKDAINEAAARLGHECRRHLLFVRERFGPHPYP